jgi:methionine-gamma-lyase
MSRFNPKHGLGTLVNHVAEGEDPTGASVVPIYQTSTFSFPDAATGAAIFKGEQEGYIYTRFNNPNMQQVVSKLAALEGLELLRAQPQQPLLEVVSGRLFASGMAAATGTVLTLAQGGQTVIAQRSLYSATFNFLNDVAARYGIRTVWVDQPEPEAWEAAFQHAPQAVLAFAETPANPALTLVDLQAVAEIAHRRGAWLVVDNTFATPYCQRPLSLGADVIVHSTTKYLNGHGTVIGGAVISPHLDFVNNGLYATLKILGASPSPFDAWLTNTGLKTFEVRMARHCENALQIAHWLDGHAKVANVFYPGLESHPGHALAKRQMFHFGGMLAFELMGGLQAGIQLMDSLQVGTLVPSLGNTDSLFQHPASMSHSAVTPEVRRQMGISDGLVRFSVGIENVEDLIDDLDQALRKV